MALINWNEEYSVNVKDIDQQHQKLIALINELHENMKVGNSKNIIKKILEELVEYTVYHFGFEEKLFAKYGYPETKLHMRAHTDLIEQLKVFIRKYESGNTILSIELMNFLKDWLVNHILKADKNYSTFLNSKGIT